MLIDYIFEFLEVGFSHTVLDIIKQIIITAKVNNMEIQAQAKSSLKQLSPGDRVVAYALKLINEKIQKIYKEQKKQTDQNHMNFIGKFKALEDKACNIIVGGSIAEDDLSAPNSYFIKEQKQELDNSLNKKRQPIVDYWLTVFKNSDLGSDISQQAEDEEILKSAVKIQSNITTETNEIIFSFEDSQYVEQGSYKRLVKFNNGQPVSYGGDKVRFKKQGKGFFWSLSQDTSDQTQVIENLANISYIINDLIPYSLNFYLGVEGEEIGQDELEEQSSEQQNGKQIEKKKKVQ